MNYYHIEFNMIHVGVILLVLYFLIYLIILNRTKKLEARIGRYCTYNRKINPLCNYLYCLYKGIIRSISLFIMKIPLFSIYIEQYKIYITKDNRDWVIPADFISNKILVSILFFLFIISIKQIDGNMVDDIQIIIFILLGYIVPDIYNMIKYNRRK